MNALKHPAVQVGIGAIAGVIFGLVVGDWAGNLKVFGDLFIRLVQMAIVPLVMASVIVAMGRMSGQGAGRLAARTFGYMFTFSAVAAVVAWALATLIKPGSGMSFDGALDPDLAASAAEASTWQETILGFVSPNIFAAMADGNMVPIIIFALLFGAALRAYVASSGNDLVLSFCDQIQQITITMIKYVMYVAPIGVFALLASLTGEVGFSVVSSAGAYLLTNLAGVAVLTVIFVAVVTLRTRLRPHLLPSKLAEQTAIAVTTTSSAVTYPTVLKNAVEKVGISDRIANFVLSIGLTMGSYGAVLNYTIVAMFLAQSGGIDLSVGQVLAAMGLAILLNIGTITVPGGFPVIAMFIATTLELPVAAVGLLIAVDWFTGIMRTYLNVNGDTLVAMLVCHDEGELDRDRYNSDSGHDRTAAGVR